jgi:hypothetical protein
MSNNLLNVISNLIIRRINPKIIYESELKYKLLGIVFPHSIYAFSTSKNKSICITDKYKFVVNGSTKFMIVDQYDNHYCINNSFWYWKWNSIEDWSKIQINDKKYIHYYGFRYPLFGLFPNVYKISI